MFFLLKIIIIFNFLQHLTGIKGLSEAKVDKICEAAEKIVVSGINFIDLVFFFFSQISEFYLLLFHGLFPQNVGYITGSDALLRVGLNFMFSFSHIMLLVSCFRVKMNVIGAFIFLAL